MTLIYQDNKKRIIKGHEEIGFSSFSSFYLLVLTARVKGEKQISSSATDDEDLTVTIDDKLFPTDSPAAFSGGSLHGFSKIIYVLTFLKGRKHTVELTTDKPSNTATFESLQIYTLTFKKEFSLPVEQQAEDGDRRPWITLVLDGLPLVSFSPKVTYSRRKRDSDDVKIIVDGKIQGNLWRTIKHFLWRYAGSLLPPFSTKTEAETFTVTLSSGLHNLEFEADRMPTLHSLVFDFGITPPIPKGIPTIDNPLWTEDFYDDTEEMLLARAMYGEAGGESYEAKVAVGWAIRNRVEDSKNRWGMTYHEVILAKYQYEPFNNPRADSFKKITQPPLDDLSEKQAWVDSYKAARLVFSGKVTDTTGDANHFYVPSDQPKPDWVDEEQFTVQIGATRFYKL